MPSTSNFSLAYGTFLKKGSISLLQEYNYRNILIKKSANGLVVKSNVAIVGPPVSIPGLRNFFHTQKTFFGFMLRISE